jgi:hypothetical protein
MISDAWSFTTSTLMLETEISETLVFNSTLTRLIAREYFSTFISRESFNLTFNSVALVRERTMPTERPQLVGEVVPTFADRRCCVVSATDSHGR